MSSLNNNNNNYNIFEKKNISVVKVTTKYNTKTHTHTKLCIFYLLHQPNIFNIIINIKNMKNSYKYIYICVPYICVYAHIT